MASREPRSDRHVQTRGDLPRNETGHQIQPDARRETRNKNENDQLINFNRPERGVVNTTRRRTALGGRQTCQPPLNSRPTFRVAMNIHGVNNGQRIFFRTGCDGRERNFSGDRRLRHERELADATMVPRGKAQRCTRFRRNPRGQSCLGEMNNHEYYSFRAHPYSRVPIVPIGSRMPVQNDLAPLWAGSLTLARRASEGPARIGSPAEDRQNMGRQQTCSLACASGLIS